MTANYEDAILLIGAVRCAWCGREAYPTEAIWLTGELALATFAQPHRAECRGPRTWSVIMDTTAGPGQAFSHAPADNARRARQHYKRNSCRGCGTLAAARYCGACRCQAQTTQRRRCANRAGPEGFCAVHTAAAERPDAIPDNQPQARA